MSAYNARASSGGNSVIGNQWYGSQQEFDSRTQMLRLQQLAWAQQCDGIQTPVASAFQEVYTCNFTCRYCGTVRQDKHHNCKNCAGLEVK